MTAYPDIFRGWQRGAGMSGNWPVRVSGGTVPGADFAVHQTWKGTCEMHVAAALDQAPGLR